jgi:hypothetical protein
MVKFGKIKQPKPDSLLSLERVSHSDIVSIQTQPTAQINRFGMQPYFNPTRKTTSQKIEDGLKQ